MRPSSKCQHVNALRCQLVALTMAVFQLDSQKLAQRMPARGSWLQNLRTCTGVHKAMHVAMHMVV